MKNKMIVFSIFMSLLMVFFLFFEIDFKGPDFPIYYSYTQSIIEDGDLNPVNNIKYVSDYYFPNGIKRVSQTYNLPDFHNHGGILLWIPFYHYGKMFEPLFNKLSLPLKTATHPDSFMECSLSFSTIVFGFLILVLSYLLCRNFFSDSTALISTLCICFGTPFFYYLLFEPGNGQMVVTLFSTYSLWAIAYLIHNKKFHWLIYGLFWGICFIVKADIWAQAFFVLFFYTYLLTIKKTSVACGISFIMGIIPAVLMKLINDFLKYGTIHSGETGVFTVKTCYLKEMLFSNYRGYFYTSPIFYLCSLGIILVAISLFKSIRNRDSIKTEDHNKYSEIFIFLLSSYLIIKIIVISFKFAWGGGTTGARALLSEFPVFVLLLARFFSAFKSKGKIFVYILSLGLIFWNWLIISEYINHLDLSYAVRKPDLNMRIILMKIIYHKLCQPCYLDLKLYLCALPSIFLGLFTFHIIYSHKRMNFSFLADNNPQNKRGTNFFCILAITLNIMYFFITAANVKNNSKNVALLKNQGFFENAQIIDFKEFEKRENTGAMREMIELFTLKGDLQRVDKIKKQLKAMYGES